MSTHCDRRAPLKSAIFGPPLRGSGLKAAGFVAPLVRDHQPALRAAPSRNDLQAEIPLIRIDRKAL